MLRLLVKAMRAHQLYLQNNPIYLRAIDALRASFAPVWAHTDEFRLVVTESEFKFEGTAVLSEPTRSSDSLPWQFFKDGIRELLVLPGFEAQEVVQLLDIIQRVRKAAPDEDDLLTMMWEKEFASLRYQFVDLAAESATTLDSVQSVENLKPLDVQRIVEEEPEPQPTGIVRMEDFDSTLYFLDEHEIEYLQSAIRSEYASDLRSNVVAVLLDVFEQQTDAPVRDEVCGVLDSLTLHLLSAGQFSSVAYLLREAQVASARARDITEGQRKRLAELPDRLSAPETLMQLLQALDEAADLPPQDELSQLFEQLRAAALGTVFKGLGRLQNARLRTLLEGAAGRLAAANTNELVRLIGAGDAVVSAEAIRRAGALKTSAAVGPLGKVLADGDSASRLLAVQALGEIGTAGAMQSLERGIDDPDRDVRVAAVRTMAARAHRAALPRVEAAIKSRHLREADLTEKMAFFEAFGTLCGDSGVTQLDRLLNGKGFLGRREDPELRACAAMALGKIGTVVAMEALRRASADKTVDKEVLVRNAVNRAMRGGGS